MSTEPLEEAPERKSTSIWGRVLIVFVGVSILLIGAYYVGGYALTQQIENGYQDHNCAKVLEQGASLEKFYPESLSPFWEQAQPILLECSAYVEAESAQKAGEWSDAFIDYKAFLSKHPGSLLEPNVVENIGQTLFSWAESDQKEGDYRDSERHLLQILDEYDETSIVSDAETMLPNLYLLWADEYHQGKAFKLAEEKYLQAIDTDSKPTTSDSPTIRAEEALLTLFNDWGAYLRDEGEYEEAIKKFKELHLRLPDDISSSAQDDIAQVYLVWADALREDKEFWDALEKIELAGEAAASDQTKTEVVTAEEDTQSAFANSSGTQARVLMSSTASALCKDGTIATSSLIGINTNSNQFYYYAPGGISVKPDSLLFSSTPASMHYVACIEETDRRIQQCPYRSSTGMIYFVERYRKMWDVTVYDVLTGDELGAKQLYGVDPDACKQTENFSFGQYIKQYYGDTPNDKLNEWLASLVE